MFANFLPKEFRFFDMFDKQAAYAVEAAVYFKELTSKGTIDEEALKKIRNIEHEADEVTHTIIEQLNKTFITPFDREDIHVLAKELDDVVDMIYTIINRLTIYRLTAVNKELAEFASVIEESVLGVECAVKGLRNMKNSKSIMEYCVEVNRLENVGDVMRDKALAKLFDTEKDPIFIIKWKEIYQDAETILDICEDLANTIESILVKQA